MPIIKQAKKRVMQAAKRQKRNYGVRTGVRKALRTVADAVKAGDKAAAEKALTAAYKVIDTATKKGILHANTAARRKSSLAKMIAGIAEAKKAAPAKKTTKKEAKAE